MPLQIVRQDLTKMRVDAIVNATNEKMLATGGVDLAVHLGAGPELDKACARLAPLGIGTVKLTKGYNLDAPYIIHTSGPTWRGGLYGESILLRSCYVESLKLAVECGFNSVAFPLISSGAYGYPKDQVLKFAVQVITEFLTEHELTVYLCVVDKTVYEFSTKVFAELSKIVYGETGKDGAELWDNFEKASEGFSCRRTVNADGAMFGESQKCEADSEFESAKRQSLFEYINAMGAPFAHKLFYWIDERGMTDVECYKRANVDKKTFSKIRCNPKTYKPSKQTAVAFAIALKLNMSETQDLLASAGLTLSRSVTFDKIIRYFINREEYDIYKINEALFEFDQVLLGC